MIGPKVQGFRVGQRVRVISPENVNAGKVGYITMIQEYRGVGRFFVELEGAPARVAHGFTAGELQLVKGGSRGGA